MATMLKICFNQFYLNILNTFFEQKKQTPALHAKGGTLYDFIIVYIYFFTLDNVKVMRQGDFDLIL